MPPEIEALVARVTTLEHWRIQSDIANARAEEQRKHLDARFDALEKKLGAVSDNLSWIVRLVLGGIVLAIIAFAMGGGLKLVS